MPNLTPKQRSHWIKLAQKLGVINVILLFLDFTLEERSKRFLAKNQTLPEKFDDSASVLKRPLRKEGFSTTFIVQTEGQLNETLQKLE